MEPVPILASGLMMLPAAIIIPCFSVVTEGSIIALEWKALVGSRLRESSSVKIFFRMVLSPIEIKKPLSEIAFKPFSDSSLP